MQQQFGYHFGLGASIRTAARLELGAAALGVAWRADSLGELGSPDPTPGHHPTAVLSERWNGSAASASWRLGGWLRLHAPRQRAPSALDGTWKPPAVAKAR